MRICGQWFDKTLLARIDETVRQTPQLNRSSLAKQVCAWLDWTDGRGQPQLGGARKALAELHRRGAVTLPEANRRPARTHEPPPADAVDPVSIDCDLASLGPVAIECVDTAAQRLVYRQLMQQHPLGDRPLCGAQLRYLIVSPLGYLGAAAFQCGSFVLSAREQWIGWSESIRRGQLSRLVANTRYLILPTVRVPHLASHVLGRLVRQLPPDWEARYGVRPLLMETFVHPEHKGTCYKAAGWECVGDTAGRRDGVAKAVWLRELAPGARERLRQGAVLLPFERPAQPKDWIENEFGGLRVWDRRLTERLYRITGTLWNQLQAPDSKRSGADRAHAMGAFRFFKNPKVTPTMLLDAHRQAVVERMAGHRLVLVPQATTVIHCSGDPRREPADTLHLTLQDSHAFTAEGVPLGVVSATFDLPDSNPPQQTRCQWLDTWAGLQELAPQVPGTVLVGIGERNVDLFDLFALAHDPDSPRLLVQAHHGVNLDATPASWTAPVANLAAAGRLVLKLPQSDSRPARDAELELRFSAVRIPAPESSTDSPIDVWAVHLVEPDPPARTEALQWLLLTNIPTTTAAEALERVRWYSARQGIEAFHQVLATCRSKDRTAGKGTRPENRLAIDLVIAWRMHHLALTVGVDGQLSFATHLRTPHWKALAGWHQHVTQRPETPGTLHHALG